MIVVHEWLKEFTARVSAKDGVNQGDQALRAMMITVINTPKIIFLYMAVLLFEGRQLV
jgi:hypothetical protein